MSHAATGESMPAERRTAERPAVPKGSPPCPAILLSYTMPPYSLASTNISYSGLSRSTIKPGISFQTASATAAASCWLVKPLTNCLFARTAKVIPGFNFSFARATAAFPISSGVFAQVVQMDTSTIPKTRETAAAIFSASP